MDATVELSDEQRNAIEKQAGVRQRWKKQAVWRAEKAGQLIGWFIVDEVVGKHEFITYAARLKHHEGSEAAAGVAAGRARSTLSAQTSGCGMHADPVDRAARYIIVL